MKKITLIIALMFFTSCTVYIVNVNKTIYNGGDGNSSEMTGSELRDNELSGPENDIKPDIDIPLTK